MKPTDLTEICKAVGGSASLAASSQPGQWKVTAVTTDTRTARPGELFVAIAGEHFDGHAFLPQAASAGCQAAVVSAQVPLAPEAAGRFPGGLIVVDDTVAALGAPGGLAPPPPSGQGHRRHRFQRQDDGEADDPSRPVAAAGRLVQPQELQQLHRRAADAAGRGRRGRLHRLRAGHQRPGGDRRPGGHHQARRGRHHLHRPDAPGEAPQRRQGRRGEGLHPAAARQGRPGRPALRQPGTGQGPAGIQGPDSPLRGGRRGGVPPDGV